MSSQPRHNEILPSVLQNAENHTVQNKETDNAPLTQRVFCDAQCLLHPLRC